MTEVVEHLLRALNLNPSTDKKRKKNERNLASK
jgi:hypothetical protein